MNATNIKGNNERNQPQPTQSFFQKALDLLFTPHPSITEVGARQQARLLLIISFLIAIIEAIGVITIFLFTDRLQPALVLTAVTAVTILGYLIARTRYIKIGAYTIIWILAFAAFGRAIESDIPSASLYTQLIPAIVIASIAFPFRYLIFFSVLCNMTIAILPLLIPGYTNAGTDLGVFITLSALTIAAMRYRDNVERDRLAEVNKINQELQLLSDELEGRVTARTAALNRRGAQLQAIAFVVRAAAKMGDIQSLLTEITKVISERFGFYHTGIFLLDDRKQNAVLQAASSEGGQAMLARGHRLRVGQGVVGRTIQNRKSYIALDVDLDAAFLDNQDLPLTRSEVALPLVIRDVIIGALDIQSTQPNAFDNEDMEILQILADQVAIAIDNTRLSMESQMAMTQLESSMALNIRQAWRKYTHGRSLGYRYTSAGLFPVAISPDEVKAKKKNKKTDKGTSQKMFIPVTLRDQKIGEISLSRREGASWTEADKNLASEVATQIALALENARLVEEAQRSAIDERLIAELTASLTESTRVENVLRTATQKLGDFLPEREIVLQLISHEDLPAAEAEKK